MRTHIHIQLHVAAHAHKPLPMCLCFPADNDISGARHFADVTKRSDIRMEEAYLILKKQCRVSAELDWELCMCVGGAKKGRCAKPLSSRRRRCGALCLHTCMRCSRHAAMPRRPQVSRSRPDPTSLYKYKWRGSRPGNFADDTDAAHPTLPFRMADITSERCQLGRLFVRGNDFRCVSKLTTFRSRLH